MKLTFLLTVLFVGTLHASVNAQTRLTMNLGETNLKEVFNEIQRQTQKTVVYNNERLDLDRVIEADFNDEALEDILDKVLSGSGMGYKFTNDYIVIVPQEEPALPQAVEEQVIQGVVKDENGQPLPGVTVLLKGTTLGTATDAEGKWKLVLPGNVQNPVFVFSFVGMETQEIAYTGQEAIDVTLLADAAEMDEVVVTGMFVRKAESFTGSAKTIMGDELERVGNGNVFQSLKNLDPSLNIIASMEFGSDPNKLPTMQLRGASTFPMESSTDLRSNYQDDPNQPLFILDGFEASATKIFDLDMNRVQSITILKDAAAKAIYGSKAANGVIVIETKRPLGGEFRVSYKGSVDLTVPDLSSYNLANAAEKLEIERIAGIYESDYLPGYQQLQDQYNERMKAVKEGLDTYWLSKPLRTGVGTKHALSFEMGEQNLTGIVDVSYRYPKMFVIRPQFFMPLISLLTQASKKSVEYQRELIIARQQSIDVTNFENKLNDFRNKFGNHYQRASDKFNKAIEEIDKTRKILSEKGQAVILPSANPNKYCLCATRKFR